jgi:hypothetical protein
MTEDEINKHMQTMLDFSLSKIEEVSKMPAKSKAQSKFLNRKFGHAWVKAHHFDNKVKGLPAKKSKKK